MILKWKNIKEKVMIRIKQSRGKIINLDNNEITYYYYRIIYLPVSVCKIKFYLLLTQKLYLCGIQ